MVAMVIVETSVFTRLVCQSMKDEQYRKLQLVLIDNPKAGAVIPGSGGLRKVRWNLAGQGKRGGLRVIYYWTGALNEIYMLYVYSKNVRSDLSREQLRQLKQVVMKWEQ